jgi:hypothetical protein
MKKWKRFERLTAALHVLQLRGGRVRWDETINGYQIDVTVRFETGPERYLMIVECRDRGRAVSRDDLAAFSVKCEETKADKGVMVSATGFQSGAKDLADRKQIDTFVLSELPADWPNKVLVTLPQPFLAVRTVGVRLRPSAEWREVPDHMGGAFVSNARFVSPKGRVCSLAEAYSPSLPVDWPERVGPWGLHIDLAGEWQLVLPNISPMTVDAIYVEFVSHPRGITISANRPPEQQPSNFAYRNHKTGDTRHVSGTELPFGLDTEIEAGRYYEDIAGRRYYCESRTAETVKLVVLGSVQHGRRMWAAMICTRDQVRGHYAPITEKRLLADLKADYEVWRHAERHGLTRQDLLTAPETGYVYSPRPPE